jgi:hypothetical protein
MQRSFSKLAAPFAVAALCGFALPSQAVPLTSNLRGMDVIPPVNTEATGTLRGDVNGFGGTYTLAWRRLASRMTQAQLHFAPGRVNGGVIVTLCSSIDSNSAGTPDCPDGRNGDFFGTFTAGDIVGPAAQGVSPGDLPTVMDLVRRGQVYVKIQTRDSPNGELRGQIGGGGGGGD